MAIMFVAFIQACSGAHEMAFVSSKATRPYDDTANGITLVVIAWIADSLGRTSPSNSL